MAKEVYINGQLIDLSPGEDIVVTLQQNTFFEVRARQASFTNTITVPYTRRNRQLLEMSQSPTTVSNLPYRFLDARIVENGIDILPDGICEVKNTDGSGYKLVFYNRVVNFWTAIDGRMCRDCFTGQYQAAMDSMYAHKRTLDKVIQLNTSASTRVLYPWITYIIGQPASFIRRYPGQYEREIKHMYPAIFVKHMVQYIIEQAGYKLETNLLDPAPDGNDLYKNAILPYVGDLEKEEFTAADLAPDMSQRAFLKSMAFIYGIEFIQKPDTDNVLITKPFSNSLSAGYLDWSDKIDFSQKPEKNFAFGEWGQLNAFKWKNDYPPAMFEVRGMYQANIPFNNRTAKATYDAYESEFALSNGFFNPERPGNPDLIQSIIGNGYLEPDQSIKENFRASPRILQLRRNQTKAYYQVRTEFDVIEKFQIGGVPSGYMPFDWYMERIIDAHYTLLRRMFVNPYMLTLPMRLSAVDIESLDMGQLIYLNNGDINGLFAISSIGEYRIGRLAKVNLIHVGSDAGSYADTEAPRAWNMELFKAELMNLL